MTRRNFHHAKRAQATLEFALIIPILVALVVGMQWVTPRITTQISLSEAAGAGARAAAEAADHINYALSCNSPANPACLQSGVNQLVQLVTNGLPCPNAGCVSGVRALGQEAAQIGLAICGIKGGCGLGLGTEIGFISNAESCTGAVACLKDAQDLAGGAIETGLGCNNGWMPNPNHCPPPMNGGTATALPTCSLPTCNKSVSEEVMSAVAAKALACVAVRRALQLPAKVTTCNKGTDDPWIEDTSYPQSARADIPSSLWTLGLLPWTCDTSHSNLRPTLFTDCTGVVIESVTVHWDKYNLVATASAIPVSQFSPQ